MSDGPPGARAHRVSGGSIVLAGGGHAHLAVLADLARRPAPMAVTLVSSDLHALYSGMVPGLIEGRYHLHEARIDLPRLCAATGARFVHGSVCGLDRSARLVRIDGQPPLAYDLISLNVGILPALDGIAGAADHAIPLKPVGTLLARLDTLLIAASRADGPRRIAVIGGGAGGIEVLLALQARLGRIARRNGGNAEIFSFALVTAGELLASHDEKLRHRFRRLLTGRGIDLKEHCRVTAVMKEGLLLAGGARIPADAMLLATDAAAPRWFGELGLALDEKGFLAVGPTLQSPDDRRVFAAGDCAAMIASPRPKSGVYAVRAGPALARNLRCEASGGTPRPFHPQRNALALIGTADGRAVAVRGRLVLEGVWVARWKSWLDRRWVRKYRQFPAR